MRGEPQRPCCVIHGGVGASYIVLGLLAPKLFSANNVAHLAGNSPKTWSARNWGCKHRLQLHSGDDL